MDDLTAFISARLSEDEAAIRKLLDVAQETIELLKDPALLGRYIPGWHWWPDVKAMCERALREVAAKRAIAAGHGPGQIVGDKEWSGDPDNWDPPTVMCTGREWTAWPCTTVRQIAAVWSDHPGYRKDWSA